MCVSDLYRKIEQAEREAERLNLEALGKLKSNEITLGNKRNLAS